MIFIAPFVILLSVTAIGTSVFAILPNRLKIRFQIPIIFLSGFAGAILVILYFRCLAAESH